MSGSAGHRLNHLISIIIENRGLSIRDVGISIIIISQLIRQKNPKNTEYPCNNCRNNNRFWFVVSFPIIPLA